MKGHPFLMRKRKYLGNWDLGRLGFPWFSGV
jgi:hypothetical protein